MIAIEILLIILNCGICIYLFLKKSRVNSAFQFFYLSILSLVIAPSIFDLAEGSRLFHPFAPPIYISASLIISAHLKILFMMTCFLILEKIADIRFSVRKIDLPTVTIGLNVYDGLIALTAVAISFGIFFYGFEEISSTSFDELRDGPTGTLSLFVFYLQIVLVGVPGFYTLRFGRPYSGVVTMLLFLLCYILLGGSRQIVVFSLAIMLALTLTRVGRARYALLLVLFTVGFSSMDFVLQLIKILRNLPSMADRLDFISQSLFGNGSSARLAIDQMGSEASIRYVMYGFMNGTPPSDFGQFSYFTRTLLFWMPSTLDFAGIKPQDFEAIMFAEAMGNRIGTMHPTFFGSAYADAGFYCFIWVGWFVAVFRILDRWSSGLPPLERSLVWGACIYFSFMVARGSFYAPMVVITVVCAVAMLSVHIRRVGNPLKADIGSAHA